MRPLGRWCIPYPFKVEGVRNDKLNGNKYTNQKMPPLPIRYASTGKGLR